MSYIGGQDESGPKFTIEYQEFTDRTARGRVIGGGRGGVGGGGGGYETQIRFKRILFLDALNTNYVALGCFFHLQPDSRQMEN